MLMNNILEYIDNDYDNIFISHIITTMQINNSKQATCFCFDALTLTKMQ